MDLSLYHTGSIPQSQWMALKRAPHSYIHGPVFLFSCSEIEYIGVEHSPVQLPSLCSDSFESSEIDIYICTPYISIPNLSNCLCPLVFWYYGQISITLS